MLVYLGADLLRQAHVLATLRQKLQIKLFCFTQYSILTAGQPVPALTLQCQAPGRVASGVPILK